MFGKRKSKKTSTLQFDTLIANTTRIEGDIRFSGGIHLDGVIKGTVRADDENAVLRISEAGQVIGDVIVPTLIINGRIQGDVYASRHVELAEKASVTGNVYYNLIEMAMGAEVNGALVHQSEQAVGVGLAGDREEDDVSDGGQDNELSGPAA
ncbi:polymer-forming cytoskeletal protein [Hahella sp. SMD15-11]|uniref:Polymer-forming cytoskeletal protein n=1 Tax=Thermohahella caldifontis TaxID=3142973 RepID=A0AB39UV81_9GAMM